MAGLRSLLLVWCRLCGNRFAAGFSLPCIFNFRLCVDIYPASWCYSRSNCLVVVPVGVWSVDMC